MKTNEVICLDNPAFEALIDRVVSYIKETHNLKGKDETWITPEEAKKRLNISSDTTLLQLRNQGKIRFSQPMHKVILYDAGSIDTYLEENARNTF
ncbi:MAG: helix-turn-helix domain-containing protein [Chitinophagales bacterium]|nr:helix-turn-helix domain-containing protein [Chitinophagales bacterium]